MTVASKFQEITDAELTAEINRRRQAKIEAERKAREEKNQHIASLISAAGRGLVNFVAPAHRKGDQCTDLSHWNGFSGDCLRCTMLDIIDSGDTPSNNVELDLKITVKKIDG